MFRIFFIQHDQLTGFFSKFMTLRKADCTLILTKKKNVQFYDCENAGTGIKSFFAVWLPVNRVIGVLRLIT